jgi:hypothetical protein
MRQFLLYCLCGGLGVSTDYLVFFLSVGRPVVSGRQPARLSGRHAAQLCAQPRHDFRQRDRVRSAWPCSSAWRRSASAPRLRCWRCWWTAGVDPRIAKLLTLPMVVVLQFTLNRKLTFNARNARPLPTDLTHDDQF